MTAVTNPLSVFEYALRSPETQRQYPRRLKVFFEFIWPDLSLDIQCTKFVRLAEKDRTGAENSLMRFFEFQKQRCKKGEISESTVPNYYKAVKLFCTMNDIALNWDKIARGMPRGRKAANDRAPTMDEIKKLIEYPDRRIRPIVYVMASSGIRVGAWNELQWKHVIPLKNDKNEIVAAKLTIYPGDPEEYFTFITPEAYMALEEWMKFRSEYGEQVTGESWLMRDIWQTSNMKYGAKFGLATNPKKFGSIAITRLLERAAWEQGVRKKLPVNCKRHEWKIAHGFRKHFKTRTEYAHMKSLYVEMLLGHDTGISEPYNKPSEQMLLEEYLNVADVLTISDEHRLRKQVVEAEEKLKQMPEIEQIQAQLTNRIIEYDAIKAQLEKFQKEERMREEREQESRREVEEMAQRNEEWMNAIRNEIEELKAGKHIEHKQPNITYRRKLGSERSESRTLLIQALENTGTSRVSS